MGFKTQIHGFMEELEHRGVQPRRLAEELEKVMEASKKILPRRTFIHDSYEVRINIRDLDEKRDLFEELRPQLERHLWEKSKAKKYQVLTVKITVTIHGARKLKRNEIEIESWFTTTPERKAEPRPEEQEPIKQEAPIPPVTPRHQPQLKLWVQQEETKESGETGVKLGPVPSGLSPGAISFDTREQCFTVLLPEGAKVRIGRNSASEKENTLDVQIPTVSRKQVELSYEKGSFYLRDTGSKHGTRVNGEDIGRDGSARKLKDGDRIGLGSKEDNLILAVKIE